MKPESRLALLQGCYFMGAGLWPIFHMKSFEKVTGPKVDHWLVKTVGALIAVSGFALVSASRKERIGREMMWLGAAVPAVLGTVAATELPLTLAWALLARSRF